MLYNDDFGNISPHFIGVTDATLIRVMDEEGGGRGVERVVTYLQSSEVVEFTGEDDDEAILTRCGGFMSLKQNSKQD